MKKKAALELTSPEYEGLCWDIAIEMMKREEACRHDKLLKAGTKVREAVEEFLNGDEG